MLKYEAGAIKDWKEGNITTGTLLRVFNVSWKGYIDLVDLLETQGLTHPKDLRDKEIYRCLHKIRQAEIGIDP